MNVLVTGGAGFIGSHAALELVSQGHNVAVVDSLVQGRGNRAAIDEVSAACGRTIPSLIADVNDGPALTHFMKEQRIDAVMHFAALAYVGESVNEPLRYYRADAAGALSLLEAMERAGVHRLIFSSSCATYGEPSADSIPIRETCRQDPINPYGRAKLMAERMMLDHAEASRKAGRPFSLAMLRYFNVAGSDPKGRIGEDHTPETHLIPICLEAALGQRPQVSIFGEDYQTPDGTCVRDYVHVNDVVDAHLRVMEAMKPAETSIYNVAIGRGYSVREVIESCRHVTGIDFKAVAAPRRAGDPPTLFAESSLIQRALGWKPRYTQLDEIVSTAWEWRRRHPNGYEKSPPR